MLKSTDHDETKDMDLQAGSWRKAVFSQPPEVEKPTYEIVGPTERVDARDHVFSRINLDPCTPWYEDYYRRHPELEDIDDKSRRRAMIMGEKLLAKEPLIEQMSIATFSRGWIFGRPDYFRHQAKIKNMPTGMTMGPKVSPNPAAMTRKIKGLALYLGAGRVRIARLD